MLPDRIQDQIVAKLELLEEFPDLGAPMFDAFQGYRALLAARKTYRIVYRHDPPARVRMISIRHCRRRASRK